MIFTLGNLTFGGRVIMLVNGKPTVELPCGIVIEADFMPGLMTGNGDGI